MRTVYVYNRANRLSRPSPSLHRQLIWTLKCEKKYNKIRRFLLNVLLITQSPGSIHFQPYTKLLVALKWRKCTGVYIGKAYLVHSALHTSDNVAQYSV